MSGLLIEPLILQRKAIAIGSRREETCFTQRSEFRNHRGKLYIYVRRRLLHLINFISDENCGFKAFNASYFSTELNLYDFLTADFSFDVELMLRAELKQHGLIEQIPIAWCDSEEASTTPGLSVYVQMLHKMINFYEHYLPEHPEAEDFKVFLRELDEDSWNQIVLNLPDSLKTWKPSNNIEFNEVSANDLRKCIR